MSKSWSTKNFRLSSIGLILDRMSNCYRILLLVIVYVDLGPTVKSTKTNRLLMSDLFAVISRNTRRLSIELIPLVTSSQGSHAAGGGGPQHALQNSKLSGTRCWVSDCLNFIKYNI